MIGFLSPRYLMIGVSFALLTYHTLLTMQSKLFSMDFLRVVFYVLSCVVAYLITDYKIIPYLIPMHIKADLYGKDIYLKGSPAFETKLPECLGLGISVVFLCHTICLYGFFKVIGNSEMESVLLQCFTYIISGVFLGFVDDILELRWRDKLIFPFFFSILLIFNYQGTTSVIFPSFLKSILPFESIELSYFFFFYLICLSIFCVNSINIYAGISGLESGQSLVIGITLMLENLMCIREGVDSKANFFSLVLLGPFCATSLALLKWNKVEAKTFVGDTYCYFAGCVFACCGIVGMFPIKILLFFLPQLFNFILSLPQLFGIVFCPRHRLPICDLKTKKMTTTFPQNLNLVNFALFLTGPINEQNLGDVLIGLQVVINLLVVLALRYIK